MFGSTRPKLPVETPGSSATGPAAVTVTCTPPELVTADAQWVSAFAALRVVYVVPFTTTCMLSVMPWHVCGGDVCGVQPSSVGLDEAIKRPRIDWSVTVLSLLALTARRAAWRVPS